MNPHYQTVLTALRTVEAEIKVVKSNDGERLDAWHERKLRLAAERLADLLYPAKPYAVGRNMKALRDYDTTTA